VWADVNRDGYQDLAVVHFGFRRTEIFMNNNGVLETVPSWTYSPTSSSNAIAFGDVNGDGYPDLAIGTAREPVMVFLNTSAIPVELTSFTSKVQGHDVQLNWETVTELNNTGFEVERKVSYRNSEVGNEEWNVIGFVEGFGTTTELHNYSFDDKNLTSGKYQYRLKQIDLDGSYEYSNIVYADVNVVNEFSLEQNYPNPFNPTTKISWQSSVDSWQTLKIYDILGNEVLTLVNEHKQAGNYEVEMNATGFASGVYIYTLSISNNGEQLFRDSKQMLMIK
jgi:hypothetical protein